MIPSSFQLISREAPVLKTELRQGLAELHGRYCTYFKELGESFLLWDQPIMRVIALRL